MSTACHIHIDLFRNKQQRLPVFEDCFLDSFFCDVFVDLESYSVSIYITFFLIFLILNIHLFTILILILAQLSIQFTDNVHDQYENCKTYKKS